MISIATEYEFKHTDFHLCMMPSDPETLKLPNHLERISANAFDGISVQKIVFSAFVPTIEANAFANIENLLMVQLPFYYGYNGVDPYAFAGSTPFMVYANPESPDTVEFAEQFAAVTGGTLIYPYQPN